MNALRRLIHAIISRGWVIEGCRHQAETGPRHDRGAPFVQQAARIVVATGAVFGAAAAQADFTFPDGSSSVSGELSVEVAADVNHDGSVGSVYEGTKFGPTGSYFEQQFVPNSSHAGIVTYGGVAASGVSATPQSIRAYAAVTFPSEDLQLPASIAVSNVLAHESAMIDFTAIPELAGPSSPLLLLTYQLNGSLSVTGTGGIDDGAGAGVRFGLVSEGYYDILDYSSTQEGEGSKIVSESLSVRIAAEPTGNPLIFLATWDVEQTIYASSGMGTALADFTHTTTLTSLTFANGQSLEEFGVKVTYASGGQPASELAFPDLGGGGTQPVPEPATLTLLCTGALAWLWPVVARCRQGAGAPGGHRRGSGGPP